MLAGGFYLPGILRNRCTGMRKAVAMWRCERLLFALGIQNREPEDTPCPP